MVPARPAPAMAGEAGEAAEACARDLRVNQQQVDLNGNRVGINRPDLQFTYLGRRYHVEYDRPPPIRALDHGQRLFANDRTATIIFKTIP
jgi:hypothetical protein